MLFAIVAYFREDAEAERDKVHQAFNEHLMQRTARVRLGGPLYDEQGRRSGMLLVVEAKSHGQALEFYNDSPYTRAGLYARVDISEMRPETGVLR